MKNQIIRSIADTLIEYHKMKIAKHNLMITRIGLWALKKIEKDNFKQS